MTNSLTTVSVSKSFPITVKKNRYKHFNLAFLGTIIFSMLTLGLFNYLIDAYGVFKSPYLSQLNDVKLKKDYNDRLFRAVDIIRLKPTTLIIGSSNAKLGLNPDHFIFKNQGKEAYNLGINGTNIYEVKRHLEHAIANQKDIDLVLLGIDFFMFNKNLPVSPSFSEERIGKKNANFKDVISLLFSFDALGSSWETLQASMKEDREENYGINGFMPSLNAEDGRTEYRLYSAIGNYFDGGYKDYQITSQEWENYREIIKLCQDNNIELIVFISPSHAIQWEAIAVMGKWDIFENWKRELVKLTPVWDFSGYNTISSEKVNPIMNNYTDASHYRPNVGDLVFNRIYHQKIEQIPDDFGVLINQDNIEQHLANIRQERKIWQENRVEEAKKIMEIYNQVIKQKKEEQKQNN